MDSQVVSRTSSANTQSVIPQRFRVPLLRPRPRQQRFGTRAGLVIKGLVVTSDCTQAMASCGDAAVARRQRLCDAFAKYMSFATRHPFLGCHRSKFLLSENASRPGLRIGSLIF